MLRSKASALVVGLFLILAAGAFPVTTAQAAGSETKEEPKNTWETLYNEGMELAEEGRHAAARVKFEEAYKLQGDDPDVLNMLAFTMRKTGDLEGAFAMYEKALQKRERFPQAREYLGEAHLQAALKQVYALRSYGAEGQEELNALLDALKRAANEAAGTDFEVEPARW
jgi:tetratricopeptide (TPR) repeat protein